MISLSAEVLTYVGKFPITNTLIHTFLIDGLIVAGIVALNKKISLIPGVFQNAVEYVVEGLFSLTESISPKHAKQIFPYFFSFFLFIILANWTSLLPGFGTIGIMRNGELVPFLKGAASDINLTLGLAIIATIATQYLAFKNVGVKGHLARYFSWNPIFLFVGLLEILSIFTNVISLSFRLFGNIMAGEVVLSTISKMFAFFLPLPFMALEIIVGLVQALVFAILTMAFMAILTTPHSSEH